MLCCCRGAAAAIIVYDITSTDSFNRAKAWVRELQRQGSPNMIMALAGEQQQQHRLVMDWALFTAAILVAAGFVFRKALEAAVSHC